jgi:glycosyltransferase involved in cell wall biosynthesis
LKKISIMSSCRNEKGNITELHGRIVAAMGTVPQYGFEIVFVDNHSTDGTRDEIRRLCAIDPRVRAIFNTRNFGPVRSPWHGLLQGDGDAVIGISSDLEDPPELLPAMIRKWEEGYRLALGVRRETTEPGPRRHLRPLFYWLLNRVSGVRQIPGFTGFGLYDREVIETFRALNDPYPYFRGLIGEMGWRYAEIPFTKISRTRGTSKILLWASLDMALLAIVSHSKVPLRLATISGAAVSLASFLTGTYYLALKLTNWDTMQLGLAPMLSGLFFLMGILFFFLGLIGEYVGLIVTHVLNRPLVVEDERINFGPAPPGQADRPRPGASR